MILALTFAAVAHLPRQDNFPPVPPPMPRRAIAKPTTPPPGRHIDLYGDGKYTLFIPAGWKSTEKLKLTIHFHGAAWFAIDEHLRRGLSEPLVAVYVGEGSSVYQRAFANPDSWPKLLSHVMAETGGDSIERVDVTSFSAGYGAVRELLKQPDPPKLIRRIVLADSMYASFTSTTDKTPLKEQIDPYVEFARAAMRGEKGFVVTCSQVPTESYANSASCAQALVRAVGGSLVPWAPGAPKTGYPDYQIRSTFSKGQFFVWAYEGVDAQAHMTHPRHIADVWREVWGKG
jgi:hypothetical protein